MDPTNLITILVGAAGVLGGYMGGRKNGNNQTAVDTVHMLATQVETLRDQAGQIPGLLARIDVLENLVTQRADVEGLKEIVLRVESKIDTLIP